MLKTAGDEEICGMKTRYNTLIPILFHWMQIGQVQRTHKQGLRSKATGQKFQIVHSLTHWAHTIP